jgi:hypothetical protein
MTEDLGREMRLEQRIEDLERRIGRVDKSGSSTRSTAETAFWAIMHRLFPDDARRHMRAATREQLLAARSYLDRWIAGLEDRPGEATAPEPRAERIEIE